MALHRNAMYTSDGGRGTRTLLTEYTFDGSTGTWVESHSPVPQESTPTSGDTNSSTPSPSTNPTQTNSKTEAEKEYIEVEFNTLTGDLSVTPSKKSIKIGVNNTVEIKGVGKYLSGKYFVSSVKRSLNKDSGYSQSLTVMKNGFGDSLKKPTSQKKTSDREEAVTVPTPEFKVGDTVKIVGNATYSNASEGVKVPAWVKTKTLTIKQVSSDKARVLLMPINSWTYVRYIQKA